MISIMQQTDVAQVRVYFKDVESIQVHTSYFMVSTCIYIYIEYDIE
jgi:hypothetical protein